jgi:hypothetical protein
VHDCLVHLILIEIVHDANSSEHYFGRSPNSQ